MPYIEYLKTLIEFPVDHDFQNKAITSGKVELELMKRLTSHKFDTLFHGEYDGPLFKTKDRKIVAQEHRVETSVQEINIAPFTSGPIKPVELAVPNDGKTASDCIDTKPSCKFSSMEERTDWECAQAFKKYRK